MGEGSISSGDISEFDERVSIDNGQYIARLLKVEGGPVKNFNAAQPVFVTTADFEIVEGEFAGESLRIWYTDTVKSGTTKDGKSWLFAPGFAEMKAALVAVGAKPPANFLHGSEKHAQVTAAKVFAPAFAGKKVLIERFDDPQFVGKGKDRKPKLDEHGNPCFFRRNKVVGLATVVAAAAEYEDDEDEAA